MVEIGLDRFRGISSRGIGTEIFRAIFPFGFQWGEASLNVNCSHVRYCFSTWFPVIKSEADKKVEAPALLPEPPRGDLICFDKKRALKVVAAVWCLT